MFLLLVSILGFALFVIMNIITDSILQNPATSDALKTLIKKPVTDSLSLIFVMICVAAFIIGLIGSIAMFFRNCRKTT